LVGKPTGKRPVVTSRHKWKNKITMDLMEIGWEGVDWHIWLRTGTSGRHFE
jgi:hypothetical protein